jgi:hypothetical protein
MKPVVSSIKISPVAPAFPSPKVMDKAKPTGERRPMARGGKEEMLGSGRFRKASAARPQRFSHSLASAYREDPGG